MATGMKGICYNESSQLNELNAGHYKYSHIRKFWDETRHFTRLSSKVFDNIIYEGLYGRSVPGMNDDIMGGKRYSSIISNSGNDFKRQNVQNVFVVDENKHNSNNAKMAERKEVIINETSEIQKNLKTGETSDTQDVRCNDNSPELATTQKYGNVNKLIVVDQTEETVEKRDIPEIMTSEPGSPNDSINRDNTPDGKSQRFRSNSECSIGRTRRNSNQVDITSTPLYKEIYANNLRQYGFLLAKKLGISNQSPKELRASYLQNRQKAELRRDRSNSSFADFSRRLSNPTTPVTNGRRESSLYVPEKLADDVETPPKDTLPVNNPIQRSNTIDNAGNTILKETPVKTRMQRSNTIEYLDRSKDKMLMSAHSRSFSDITNKYSDSLTNINEILDDKDTNKSSQSRRVKKLSCMGQRSKSYSPPLVASPLSNSSETICTNEEEEEEEASDDVSEDICHERVHSGSFSDKEPSRKQPSSVMRRKHKNIRDPHKRLSVPLFNSNNGPSSPPRLSRKLSVPVQTNTTPITAMSSLSVPDLYHNSSFGKDKLIDAYCKQEVPRRKLSVESLRRHSEARERLEWRMSKLKSFEGILSEADSFMKEIKTLKAANSTEATIPE